MLLLVASIARISSVFSSIPICILRQRRRFDPPCLRAFHSPSPSALMPVLSTARQSKHSFDERGSEGAAAPLTLGMEEQRSKSFAADTMC
jgi:hypothetical protein